MPKTIVNKTSFPITAQDEVGRNVVIGPGNTLTGSDNGVIDRILANATIANFRVAQTRDGWEAPQT